MKRQQLIIATLLLLLFSISACERQNAVPVGDTTKEVIQPAQLHELVDLLAYDFFTSPIDTSLKEFGAIDIRLFLDNNAALDIAFFQEDFISYNDAKDPLTALPLRDWETSISLAYRPEDAPIFEQWLNDHFAYQEAIDLRFGFLNNGSIIVQGKAATKEDLLAFPSHPLF
ncbi:MAG: hypothetical protein AAGF89_03445 [Bacteroidota bacterium]